MRLDHNPIFIQINGRDDIYLVNQCNYSLQQRARWAVEVDIQSTSVFKASSPKLAGYTVSYVKQQQKMV